jgi:poly [ADP-ribose] polymerase
VLTCAHNSTHRFKKWEELNNHQLLFHGSPLSNFTGILSQGLRIAPPEAPVSGYAFGKGIYFADMFQKSFNYCRMGNDYSYHQQQGRKQKQVRVR